MKTNLNLIHKTTLIALCALALSPAAILAADASKPGQAHGLIKAVDNQGQQLVVTDQKTKAESTFKWNDQTKFTEHGKSVSSKALKPGLLVQLTYAPSAVLPVLERVKLSPPKGQKHSSISRLLRKSS